MRPRRSDARPPHLAAAFLDKHPGGRELLLLAAGRECTDLFTAYHVLKDQAAMAKYLAAYEIGEAASTAFRTVAYRRA